MNSSADDITVVWLDDDWNKQSQKTQRSRRTHSECVYLYVNKIDLSISDSSSLSAEIVMSFALAKYIHCAARHLVICSGTLSRLQLVRHDDINVLRSLCTRKKCHFITPFNTSQVKLYSLPS